jgi:hypothetical protein
MFTGTWIGAAIWVPLRIPLLSEESCENPPVRPDSLLAAAAELASPATPIELPAMFSGTLIGA